MTQISLRRDKNVYLAKCSRYSPSKHHKLTYSGFSYRVRKGNKTADKEYFIQTLHVDLIRVVPSAMRYDMLAC